MDLKFDDNEPNVNFDTKALADVFFNWRYAEEDFDPFPVMNAIVEALDKDTQIVFPIIVLDDDYQPIPKAELEGVDVLNDFDSDHMVIPALNSGIDDHWVPVFTSEEELLKGDDVFFIYVSLTAAWDMVLSDENINGLVFNPWSDNIPLDKAMMKETMEHDPASHISLIKGDITKLHVDAIVNAANKSLLGGGGVDGAIHRAAGRGLLEECKKLRGCETGEAKITSAYRLPCKFVIHTVGPVYKSAQESGELLAQCYRNSLELAYKNGSRSIAFPCISTGAYGYPMHEAVPIALLTISDWLSWHDEDVIDVYCCCYSDSDYEMYLDYEDALGDEPEFNI